MKRFPDDPLEQTLRNVFDFDINRPETLDALYDILRKHKIGVDRIGIDAVRGGAKTEGKKPVVIEFKPTGDTSLNEPKYGKDTDKAHGASQSLPAVLLTSIDDLFCSWRQQVGRRNGWS
jgi:hypothetical protein